MLQPPKTGLLKFLNCSILSKADTNLAWHTLPLINSSRCILFFHLPPCLWLFVFFSLLCYKTEKEINNFQAAKSISSVCLEKQPVFALSQLNPISIFKLLYVVCFEMYFRRLSEIQLLPSNHHPTWVLELLFIFISPQELSLQEFLLAHLFHSKPWLHVPPDQLY